MRVREMFDSLLRSKKRSRPSETTPLLAALQKYRSRHSDGDEPEPETPGLEAEDDYEAAEGQYNGRLQVDDEDDDRRPFALVVDDDVLILMNASAILEDAERAEEHVLNFKVSIKGHRVLIETGHGGI